MPSPINDPLITTFGRLLEAKSRLEQRLNSALSEAADLPLAWFEVLIRLARSDEQQLTMGELAGQIALTTGGVTRLVDRMQAAGLVERRPCTTDRRVSYLGITHNGREKVDQAATAHSGNLQEVFAGFSEHDLAALNEMLDRLRPANKEQRLPNGNRAIH